MFLQKDILPFAEKSGNLHAQRVRTIAFLCICRHFRYGESVAVTNWAVNGSYLPHRDSYLSRECQMETAATTDGASFFTGMSV